MDEVKESSELNTRQWTLYKLIKAASSEGKWLGQLEIFYKMINFYPSIENEEKFHDSTARTMITEDVRIINQSSVIQKIILSGHKGHKLATEEEYREFEKKKKASILSALKRYYHLKEKGDSDGQMRLRFNSEREYIEAFIHDCE